MQEPDIVYIYISYIGKYSEIFDTIYTYEKCKLHVESHISKSGGITSEHKLTDLFIYLLQQANRLHLKVCQFKNLYTICFFSNVYLCYLIRLNVLVVVLKVFDIEYLF
jgi:hypothetical protein